MTKLMYPQLITGKGFCLDNTIGIYFKTTKENFRELSFNERYVEIIGPNSDVKALYVYEIDRGTFSGCKVVSTKVYSPPSWAAPMSIDDEKGIMTPITLETSLLKRLFPKAVWFIEIKP